jgi:hypothetical protein
VRFDSPSGALFSVEPLALGSALHLGNHPVAFGTGGNVGQAAGAPVALTSPNGVAIKAGGTTLAVAPAAAGVAAVQITGGSLWLADGQNLAVTNGNLTLAKGNLQLQSNFSRLFAHRFQETQLKLTIPANPAGGSGEVLILSGSFQTNGGILQIATSGMLKIPKASTKFTNPDSNYVASTKTLYIKFSFGSPKVEFQTFVRTVNLSTDTDPTATISVYPTLEVFSNIPAGTQQLSVYSEWGTAAAADTPTAGTINFNILELPNQPLGA